MRALLPSPRSFALLASVALSGMGCNAIFGVDDLEVTGPTSSTGTGAQGTGGSTDGAGGTGGGAACGPGLQDKDADGVCAPACGADTCSGNGACDDTTGEAICSCNLGWEGGACSTCATGYVGAACDECDLGYQDNDADGSCLPACTTTTCGADGICDDASGVATCTCKPLFGGADCSTPCAPGTAGPGCAYHIIYGLDLVDDADWNVPADIPYDVDDAAGAGPYDRVAYRYVLNTSEIWVEMDPFSDDATMLGVPIDWIWDIPITNLAVISFATNLQSMTTPSSGSLEFWSDCYAEGPNGAFDHDDDRSGSTDCYGSMQVHAGTETVFSFNSWTNGSVNIDVGFGTAPTGNADWTFAGNGASFSTKRIEVYVRE